MLDEQIQQYSQWSGSQDHLVATVEEIEHAAFGSTIRSPNKRTASFYRTKNIIDPATGKKFSFRHLLQFLLARKLSREGWTIKQLSQTVGALNNTELTHYLKNNVSFDELLLQKTAAPETRNTSFQADQSSVTSSDPEKHLPLDELTIRLLAKGIISQFDRVTNEHQIVDGNQIPLDLKRAMSLLGKLCLHEGLEDCFASVHDTLFFCRFPFSHSNWPLKALKSNTFPFAMVNLIDVDHRCPTLDCLELAQYGNEANIREHFTFELLKQTCASFGGRRHEVYTLLREFVGRHPITSVQEIVSFTREHNIGQAEQFLTQECYRTIGSSHLIDDQIYLCNACGSPLSQVKDFIGQCTIRQCGRYHQQTDLSNGIAPPDDGLLLQPYLQAFWFGPAIDELAIFDLVIDHGFEASLYPASDSCDVAIDGNDIGIDIKSFASPYLLAQSLNQSVGGLIEYQRKVIGISDTSINNHTHYLDILESNYSGKDLLEFKSVSDIASWLKEAT